MKVIIAPDSFKESLSAYQVCCAIKQGMQRVFCDAEFELVPMADGGEGSVDAMLAATAGNKRFVQVQGPAGEPVEAFYGLIDAGKTAIVEMAAASGLHLLGPQQRDARYSCSFGTGELINDALQQGVEHIIVCLGGSATNDAGAGMLRALGFKLLDAKHDDVAPGGIHLSDVVAIDDSHVNPLLAQTNITLACDVDNPLCGPQGASHIFGPQKGATAEVIEQLDGALKHFAELLQQTFHCQIIDRPGSGAAGGTAAALMATANAQMQPGIDMLIEQLQLADRIATSDLVITGEGRIDGQSVHGKTPIGVSRVSRHYHVPTIAVCGSIGDDYEKVYAHGIDAVFSILDKPQSLADALIDAEQNLANTSENIARALKLAGFKR
ncbi:glycerate kinase [Thalassotalea sp. HSM 43]|uniref:glycerate kinase n=1 Tax=Thalassotalea sp. HSM 43 TaxID=2552945 RepID=UPI001081285C|nr:glycerate kinase [Thalassotalea sp. HSM 43]QBY04626.1 glycerate kinase [Thalassotalea sp. HSM 43]